ncbi:sulfite exporter TauE/SafE family protein [Microbacterium halophytorum]|uniref:sulfite exporter TauE/SafE family protein n=1 Tax=Microbacterium halophytorum TaxID=2067568 RepID=UPI000CFC5425|nr:sulfite exporter TauE/SafE family protein [Microbacterium halophytorum]
MGSVIVLALVLIGVLTGLTTVLFGFGGGFVTVPVIIWVDAAVGSDVGTVAVATSAIVMVVNAAVATAAAPRPVLARLRGRGALLCLLAAGGLFGALAALEAPAEVNSWGFVIYVAVTIVDALARPGFLRSADAPSDEAPWRAIPTALGAPIGAVASFLGVGGSVMTVPLMRRAGLPMRYAAALANPLTLAIIVPAAAVFLFARRLSDSHGALLPVGVVDLGAAALLLAGAIPVIVAVRRRPPYIPDRVHARAYVGLLAVVVAVMLIPLLRTRGA